MVILDLSDSVGLGVIFELSTGVVFTQQTAGTSCLRPMLEGAYVPLRNDYSVPDKVFISPEVALSAHFTGPRWCGSGAMNGLDTQDADVIDAVLSKSGLNIRVNRARLRESHESWVHVLVGPDVEPPLWSGLPTEALAILTWSNSD